MDLPEDERAVLRDLASALGFDLNDQHVDEALDAATTLGKTVDSTDGSIAERLQRESVGDIADDEYGALLDTYDEPRTEIDSGPLAGFDIAVKDVIAVADLRMTCGSDTFSCVPLTDAAVVSRLLDAGARLRGKANSDAFAFGPTGEFSERRKVVNPAAPDRVPGGSSSGSAAAVAGELVDVTLGTDTGGSVRIPSACCGVVGAKPTHSLVPRHGFVDLAPSTDTIAPIAPDVKTAGRVLETIAGPDPRDPSSALVQTGAISADIDDTSEFTISVPSSFLDVSSDAVTSCIRDLLADLRARPEIDTVDEIDFSLGDIDEAYPLVLAAEFAWILRQSGIVRGQGTKYSEEWRQILSMYRENLTDHIAMRVLPAAFLDEVTDGRSYVQAREKALAFGQQIEERLARYDVLLVPTLRVLPPERGEITATEGVSDITGNTAPFSLVGNPVVTVPAGSVDGAPVGVQIIARPFEDGTALSGARLVEKARA
jgi:aspartyl-tRNA(Asn)/glutamyl-tRNA(Gln) amidotransferase subunit A